MRAWLLAFRLKTLTAAIVPVFVGTAIVASQGLPIYWSMTAFALLSALFIQIGTNLFNDAIDFKKGADTAERLGPTRVTQSGLVSPNAVMAAGGISFLLALLCGIPLVIQGGWPLLIIGLLSLAMGYLYTGGPFPLAYQGLGDIFVILFFGLIAVMGTYYLHSLRVDLCSLAAGLQIGALAAVLIAINNARDVEQDRLANKKTLAVRFGIGFIRWEILFLVVLAFAPLIFYWRHFMWAALFPAVLLPRAIRLVFWIWQTPPSEKYNQFLAEAAKLHLLFGVLFGLGLWKM